MYIYPDNLKAKATMWLWKLKDLAIIGIIVLLCLRLHTRGCGFRWSLPEPMRF